MAYGTKVVSPIELKVPTYQVENFNESANNKALALESDLLEELKERAHLRVATLKQATI